MDQDSFIKLATRYLSGSTNDDENARLHQIIERDPERKELFEQLDSIWQASQERNYPINENKAWQKLNQKRKSDTSNQQNRHIATSLGRQNHPGSSRNSYLAIAAVLLISASLVVGFWIANQNADEPEVATSGYHTISTEEGETQKLELMDSSEVTLGPSSSLKISENYGNHNRNIQLRGEAYFDVKDHEHDFLVELESATVSVVGTRFTASWWGDGQTEVIVESGRVEVDPVQPNQHPETLEAGFRWGSTSNQSFELTEIDAGKYLSWVEGGLYFENTPLSQVVTELQRRFAIEIDIENPEFLEYEISAQYADESIEEIMQLTSLSVGGELHKQNDNHFVIK